LHGAAWSSPLAISVDALDDRLLSPATPQFAWFAPEIQFSKASSAICHGCAASSNGVNPRVGHAFRGFWLSIRIVKEPSESSARSPG
jgi:hypothetical protein